ncbi:hypothetical protein ETAA8_30090 [Anatilimnocola aggregata]|uniref:DUF5615 domain-containing protein n=1 Tax=Anatilimnocola aggregata TaxID=2528021 RepID=A0A517YCG1_9BACT|nr:DUF5615 family PIN-like protein [Anatilimnocola aggregata]QDU27918.1 hypothetical protein ETAA8_30090 [Anatilimnocola aggregata]
MLRLLSDENLNGDIVRGLMRIHPDLDCVRVQDVGLMNTADELILEWAARENRVLVTYDVSTVPPAAYQRVAESKPMPGVIIVPDQLATSRAIADIAFLSREIQASEIANQVFFLPF